MFTALAAVCLAPLFRWEFVTAVDYPTHLSVVRVLRFAFEDPGAFRATFDTRLLQPYWGFYLPVLVLSAILPLQLAAKLVAAAILLMVPIALLVLARTEGLEPRVSLLGFPLAYSFSAYFGFFPFLAGTGLGLLGLVPVLFFARTRSRRALAAVHVASVLVFAAHATAWGFWLGWVGWILLSTRPRLPLRDVVHAASAFVLPALLLLAWNRSVDASGTVEWMREHAVDNPLGDRWRDLLHTGFVSVSPEAEAALGALFLAAGLLAYVGRHEAGDGGRRLRWLGLGAALLLAYFVVPHQLAGLNFAYERTLGFALLFPVLAGARAMRFPRAFTLVAALASIATAASVDEMSRIFNAEMAGLKTCLARTVPRGTLMGLLPDRFLREARLALFLHTPDYYTYEKLGRVYTHSMETLPTVVSFRDRTLFDGPRPTFDVHPYSFRYPAEARNVRYFLVRGRPLTATPRGPLPTDGLLLKGGLARSRLVCESGLWRLYENGDFPGTGGAKAVP